MFNKGKRNSKFVLWNGCPVAVMFHKGESSFEFVLWAETCQLTSALEDSLPFTLLPLKRILLTSVKGKGGVAN